MSLNQNLKNDVFEIESLDRWAVFRRLQELEIPCSCGYYQPLTAQINSPATLIQVWSVLRQAQASRVMLINHLENCWHNDRILNEESEPT